MISRTERLSAIKGVDDFLSTAYVNDSININKNDLWSYLEINYLIAVLKQKNDKLDNPCVDFIKSCPFILSFMGDSYKFKKNISALTKVINEKTTEYNEIKNAVTRTKNLWIDQSFLDKFESLSNYNARLSTLVQTFWGDLKNTQNTASNNTIKKFDPSMLLWVPPSRPYYPLQGAYKNTENFSKMIIFSKWAMVPKMIASLISYEEERLILLDKRSNKNKKISYFDLKKEDKEVLKRPNFIFTINKNNSQNEDVNYRYGGLELLPLLYPSVYLSSLYNPIESFVQIYKNTEMTENNFNDLKSKIRDEIEKKLKVISERYTTTENNEQIEILHPKSWYYLSPFLIDIVSEYKATTKTIAGFNPQTNKDTDTIDDDSSLSYFTVWLNRYKSIVDNFKNINNEDSLDSEQDAENSDILADILEKKVKKELMGITKNKNIILPEISDFKEELVNFLVNVVLASPAICAYRTNGRWPARASYIARLFIKRFNERIPFLIINEYSKEKKTKRRKIRNHTKTTSLIRKNVMALTQYCVDGNFQAMFDEFHHVLSEDQEKFDEVIFHKMISALSFRNSTSSVEIISKPKNGKSESVELKEISMRNHIAVAFNVNKKDDEKASNRNESVRAAFNSPLWPFVLASTSCGQEGLDFHNYCRKIMHWNLPSNPIDIEQREGRINRYKCLAVRQSAVKFCDEFCEKNKQSFIEAVESQKINNSNDLWHYIFSFVKKNLSSDDKNLSDIVPYWIMPDQPVKIERHVPMYPFSMDISKYEHLIKIVSLYRLTLGQPRQEELLNNYFKSLSEEQQNQLKCLFINLSPYFSKK